MPRSYHLQCNTVDSVREDFCNKGYSISSGWFYSVAFFFLVLCCSVTPGLLQASLFYPDLLSSALFGLISDGRDADTIAFQNVCDTSELRQKFLKKRCAFFFFFVFFGIFLSSRSKPGSSEHTAPVIPESGGTLVDQV